VTLHPLDLLLKFRCLWFDYLCSNPGPPTSTPLASPRSRFVVIFLQPG